MGGFDINIQICSCFTLLCDDVLTLTVKPPVQSFSCHEYLEIHVHEAISVYKVSREGCLYCTCLNCS